MATIQICHRKDPFQAARRGQLHGAKDGFPVSECCNDP